MNDSKANEAAAEPPLDCRVMPCPFCGSDSISFREGSTFRWMQMECDECGATCGEVRVQTLGPGTVTEWNAKAEADAMAAWNTRHNACGEPGLTEPGKD